MSANHSEESFEYGPSPEGLRFERTFSADNESPFEQVTWEKRSAKISDDKGETIFEQPDVEVPSDWS